MIQDSGQGGDSGSGIEPSRYSRRGLQGRCCAREPCGARHEATLYERVVCGLARWGVNFEAEADGSRAHSRRRIVDEFATQDERVARRQIDDTAARIVGAIELQIHLQTDVR